MLHELFDTVLKVTDSNVTFERFIKKEDFLIISDANFRDKGDWLFPETTREFYDFIREFLNDEIIVDIAISDEDFKCIE